MSASLCKFELDHSHTTQNIHTTYHQCTRWTIDVFQFGLWIWATHVVVEMMTPRKRLNLPAQFGILYWSQVRKDTVWKSILVRVTDLLDQPHTNIQLQAISLLANTHHVPEVTQIIIHSKLLQHILRCVHATSFEIQDLALKILSGLLTLIVMEKFQTDVFSRNLCRRNGIRTVEAPSFNSITGSIRSKSTHCFQKICFCGDWKLQSTSKQRSEFIWCKHPQGVVFARRNLS